MWSVALSAVVSLKLHGGDFSSFFKRTLGFSRRAFVYYLLAPLIVYLALVIYIAIAIPTGHFDFNQYLNTSYNVLKSVFPTVPKETLRSMVVTSAYLEVTVETYIAALTLNALAALSKELGWRGYLYQQLGFLPTLKNTVTIGTVWGLWHAPAILLLGYNYSVNRLAGVALFTLLCITLTYPLLLITKRANSILPAISMQGAFNALWPLTLIASSLPVEQRETLLGLGILGILSWTLTDLIL